VRILYLDLDTLRPDHLSCYGYHRNTSPNIDRIANEGVRFTNYHCTDAPCLPSRAALMSGRFGIHTGVVGHGGTAADMRLEGRPREFKDQLERDAMPAFLRQQGFKTVSVSPFGERHSAWWFYAGFNEMYNTGRSGAESAEEITPTALKWINENAKEDNWFLHINYWDPHTTYRAPKEFGNPFKDDPIPDWLTEDIIKQHNNMVGLHGSRELAMFHNRINPAFWRQPGEVTNLEQARMMFDGYDCGIRYMDDHIGMLFDALAKQGVMDDLAIIISSDHGENLGELQLYAEHGTADYITTRIPMIVRWPGGKVGRVDDGLHYNLDLSPTFAELFGKDPMPRWDGASYAKSITQGADCGRDYLVVSQCAHTAQRGVRLGPWMYIRTQHDFYHLFPKEMLFNVEQDPHEQNNLADERKDVCMDAVYKMSEWHDSMMMSMDYDVDPLWTVMREGGPYHGRGHLKAYCEYLEQTGRSWAIPELKKRHPQEFV
jgi:choline-sulfatase